MLNSDEMNGKSPFLEGVTCEQRDVVDAVITRNCSMPGTLVPIVEEAKQLPDRLPESTLHDIALRSKIPIGDVWCVLPFIFYFNRVTGFHTYRQTIEDARGVFRCLTAVTRSNKPHLSFFEGT